MRICKFMFFLIFISFTAVACSTFTMSDENYSGHQNLEELRPDQPADRELNEQLGYVHYTKEDMDDFNDSEEFLGPDRTQTADMISRRVLLSDDFEEVASLVTDKEIIVAYNREANLDPEEARDIAEKTAASFVPGSYDVYTSDQVGHIERIQQIHLSSAREELNQEEIKKLIQEIEQAD